MSVFKPLSIFENQFINKINSCHPECIQIKAIDCFNVEHQFPVNFNLV